MSLNNLPFLIFHVGIKSNVAIWQLLCKLESAFFFAVLNLAQGGNDGGQSLT
jgi:hypothetical protein